MLALAHKGNALYEGDQIDLLYVLRPHGWTDLLLYVHGEIFQWSVSHVFSDPVAELATLAIQLHNRAKTITAILWDEPGGHSFTLNQLPEQHHKYAVRLCWFPEGPPASSTRTETLLTEFIVKADHLVKLIHGELEKVVQLLEEKSYREHRDFPFSEFQKLRSQLAG